MKVSLQFSTCVTILLCCIVVAGSFASANEEQHKVRKRSRSIENKSRCRGASCIPKIEDLRAYLLPDLDRTPLLPNDKPVKLAGFDKAAYDLEQHMMGDKFDEGILKDSRGGSIFSFREQIDYDTRVATSPAIKTVCEIGFLCGQSMLVWLEANPTLKVVGFDENQYWIARKCLAYLQNQYPGRILFTEGISQDSVLGFIKNNSANGVYQGPKCDLVRTDARAEYPLRRQDVINMMTMMHCNSLILHNDVCDPSNCHLYDTKNCYWDFGNCNPQPPLFFEGPTMVLEELLRAGVVELVDTFFHKEPKFHKSFALSRVKCPAGSLVPLPAVPMFQGKEAQFTAAMQACHKKGGCAGPITVR